MTNTTLPLQLTQIHDVEVVLVLLNIVILVLLLLITYYFHITVTLICFSELSKLNIKKY